jgi:hypothetical protein
VLIIRWNSLAHLGSDSGVSHPGLPWRLNFLKEVNRMIRTMSFPRDAPVMDPPAGAGGEFTITERRCRKEIEREYRKLRRSNDILCQTSAYFAKVEFDRLWKKIIPLLDILRGEWGLLADVLTGI